jgi:lipopolysaccharide export system permease protein
VRKLNRYLIANILKLLFLCELAGMIIFVTIEFFDHVQLFTRSLDRLLLSFVYIGLRMPYFFNLILPLAFLISILILIIMMIRGNEVVAIRTAGISTFALMKPFLSLSLLLVILSFVLSEWVIPYTYSASEYVYQAKIKREQVYVVFKNDKIWFKRDNVISNIDFFDTKKDVINGVTVLEMSPDYIVQRRFDAAEGIWKDGDWHFLNVTDRKFGPEGIISKTVHPAMTGLIKEPPSLLKIVEKGPEEMSYKELSRYISKLKRNGHDVRRYMVDLYNKISFPFINVIMVLVAFSLGLRYAKTKHISAGVFWGIAVGAFYWILHSISLSFGYSEIFPALFAAWLSNLLFFSLGVIGIITVRT